MNDDFFGFDIGIVLTFFAAMIYLIFSDAQCSQYSPTTSNFEWIHKNVTEY